MSLTYMLTMLACEGKLTFSNAIDTSWMSSITHVQNGTMPNLFLIDSKIIYAKIMVYDTWVLKY